VGHTIIAILDLITDQDWYWYR